MVTSKNSCVKSLLFGISGEITEKKDEAVLTEDFMWMPFQPFAYCRGEGQGVDGKRVTRKDLSAYLSVHEHPAYGLNQGIFPVNVEFTVRKAGKWLKLPRISSGGCFSSFETCERSLATDQL